MKRILIFILILCASVAFAALGPELQPNPNLTGTGGTPVGSATGVVADGYRMFATITAIGSKTVEGYQAITTTAGVASLYGSVSLPTLTLGTEYTATITVESVTGGILWRVCQANGANVQFSIEITTSGTYTQTFIADATFLGTNHLASIGAGESITVSEMSIKEVVEDTNNAYLGFFNFFN